MLKTRRDIIQGVSTATLLTGSALLPSSARAFAGTALDATTGAKPIDLQRNGSFDGIINLYVENNVDLQEAKRLGVLAVIYRTSIGLRPDKDDRVAYHANKQKALDLGLLWGAFHVPGMEDVDQQLARFLEIENGEDGRTLMVLDWEKTKMGTPKLDQIRYFVQEFYKSRGYFPMIYGGGDVLYKNTARHRDDILAQCPLWYIDVVHKQNPRLPTATWSDYTFWQYATDKRHTPDPYPRDVLRGADWSRFKGTSDQLSNAWPFRTR